MRLLGGALGVGLAYGGLRVLVAIGPANLPRLAEISIDPVVLGFALAVSLLSGLLFGLIPILKYAGPRLATALGGGRGASLTRERQRSQHALVAVQIALALVLLVSAGLMIRSFQALRRVDPGFTQPERVQTFSISIPPTDGRRAGARDAHAAADAGQDRRHSGRGVGGVHDAVADGHHARPAPRCRRGPGGRWPDAAQPADQVRLARHVPDAGHPTGRGTRLHVDRIYDKRDVAIVSENLARELWGSPAAALGKRIREYYDTDAPGARLSAWQATSTTTASIDRRRRRVTGRRDRTQRFRHSRLPAAPGQRRRPQRTRRHGEPARSGARGRVVGQATLPLAQVRTLGEVYDQSMARTSFTLVMLAMAGAMALLLGVVGLYGVISYAVSQRRREIGIRLALGAQPREIRGLFVRRGLVLAGIGVAIGLGGAAGFTRLMQSLLFGISPLDPLTFTAMPVVLAAAAVLASYLPARRAVAVDPVETLRAE